MTLEEAEASIGAAVTYRTSPIEHGILVYVKGRYAFVLYQGDTAPKATLPEDLELRFPGGTS